MQRWIVLAALVLSLLGGGLVFGYWNHRQSRPDAQWIPLPFNPESSREQREATVGELRKILLSDEVLAGVSRDCDIVAKWKLGSEQAAVEQLRSRAIIKEGETAINGTLTATLDIGFTGTVGEKADLRSLSQRIMTDVQRVITPAASQQTEPSPTGF